MLATVTLNQCLGEETFLGFKTYRGKMYPKVELTSTMYRDLTVYLERPGVIVAEWRTDGALLRHQFIYTTTGPNDWPRLSGFTGTAVKESAILQKTIAWQMVPLRGQNPKIELECSTVLLDGIPE